MAKQSFEVSDGEILVRQGKATYLKTLHGTKKMMTYLTNFRLVIWGKDDSSFIYLGGWGLLRLLINHFRKEKIVLEIPCTSIEDVVVKKTGFTRKLVLTANGTQHHLIPATDTDLWMADIISVIQTGKNQTS